MLPTVTYSRTIRRPEEVVLKIAWLPAHKTGLDKHVGLEIITVGRCKDLAPPTHRFRPTRGIVSSL